MHESKSDPNKPLPNPGAFKTTSFLDIRSHKMYWGTSNSACCSYTS